MIANMLEGMEHEEAARLAGLSRSAAYEWHNRYEGLQPHPLNSTCCPETEVALVSRNFRKPV
jgi:transposase